MSDKKSMDHVEVERQRMLKEWGVRNFMNKLEEMMRLQKEFASKFIKFDTLTEQEKIKWTKELLLCDTDESSEVLNHLPWKHWSEKKEKVNEVEVQYELIDKLHFLLTLMLVWGMTPLDVFSMYVAKNHENHNRQKGGY
jgi:dimeric dUTPase (all-alpha-NTP-PPase superfamily)